MKEKKHTEEGGNYTSTTLLIENLQVHMVDFVTQIPYYDDSVHLLYGHDVYFFVKIIKSKLLQIVKSELESGDTARPGEEEDLNWQEYASNVCSDIDSSLNEIDNEGAVRILLSPANDNVHPDDDIGCHILSTICDHTHIINKWWMEMNVLVHLPNEWNYTMFPNGLLQVAEKFDSLKFDNLSKEYRLNIAAIDKHSLRVRDNGYTFVVDIRFDFEPMETLGDFLERVKNKLKQFSEDGLSWIYYGFRRQVK